jgi:hypothetical protein
MVSYNFLAFVEVSLYENPILFLEGQRRRSSVVFSLEAST